MRPTNELVRIAAVGGGLTLDASTRPTEDLIRIATSAALNGARVIFTNAAAMTSNDLIRIGVAGRGVVHFEDS